MDLTLLLLDEDSLHDHVFERYIELNSNSETLKQDLGILNRSETTLTIDIEPYIGLDDTSRSNGNSKNDRTKKRDKNRSKKKESAFNNDFYSLNIEQSLTSLNSSKDNNNSTTGYVLWSTTPFFLRWLLYHPTASVFRNGGDLEVIAMDSQIEALKLPHHSIVDSKLKVPPIINYDNSNREGFDCSIIELGSGVSGMTAVVLSNFVNDYIATDQKGIISKLKQNISENLVQISKKECVSRSMDIGSEIVLEQNSETEAHKKPVVNLEVMPIDWETFDISKPALLPMDFIRISQSSNVVTIIAMDVIYNEYLIDYFLKTLIQLIDFFKKKNIQTHCLIGIHLRSQDIITEFLEKAIIENDLKVFSLTNDYLNSSRFSFYYI
ncbi:hypothetical protein TPHA_0A01470 [Tetrapisispora phaffii CBS 4417]|uniref:Ribosomal lysine N-methyltransferase 5 n=1 Tax=Tetrapisispora phaffii (strain ATCC 24235 / CBS 4417 / NBRC 1672 / NRRL Y-8282 / UCD 70-5) TaxID=1071381 RepID=G8BMV2_TETPH|nr:hypothetical protein TPHA_0A01470 [Tetrapisispora phaffii CBS 4417]CCE61230.1 hypothetical protein TPHA_0A01470 [Tetrapisispora phaffii CBS 4417]